ncbi:unnamed protein product [Fusarium graminearum]|uniref:Chromosome 1, complete genome n=1 Tax=Gibberella zeae (strain ATCC MYA-4620 / CBS 123657 / FGSC 9075 / NRRL 31084 / PH-1) TaxID=229533 RepID=I1SA46_GIBZE|nr:hypothetical protein FGSG_13727 [Fusarium graminearum PH-1]ESU16953.1 hypothetical protein FGSG_13727 [Fusarium graminearum PH-1]EYB28857.1 hypothetical protein FG05_13727 [Fusarium graminearum]CEF75641.1 unnamed protein product [Fusarium graminearum]CZS78920.1 unnamed protein product [Fusarium graminearum]|eukprot:XP_011319215.1 hypothetical protein FGSG_13727 [Fusarium graminearum PH-1]
MGCREFLLDLPMSSLAVRLRFGGLARLAEIAGGSGALLPLDTNKLKFELVDVKGHYLTSDWSIKGTYTIVDMVEKAVVALREELQVQQESQLAEDEKKKDEKETPSKEENTETSSMDLVQV